MSFKDVLLRVLFDLANKDRPGPVPAVLPPLPPLLLLVLMCAWLTYSCWGRGGGGGTGGVGTFILSQSPTAGVAGQMISACGLFCFSCRQPKLGSSAEGGCLEADSQGAYAIGRTSALERSAGQVSSSNSTHRALASVRPGAAVI
jgi:hypothetical protein